MPTLKQCQIKNALRMSSQLTRQYWSRMEERQG